jgi:pyridoxamine 5'-phosphate oxidase
MSDSVASLRKEYHLASLSEADVAPDPLDQFQKWFDAAVAARIPEPNATTLATASRDGRPSARIVLLKRFSKAGFDFFTNYDSRKGQDLAANPWAALVFFWPDLERQVRVEGHVEKLTPEESDAYFNSRPLESRLGAWASQQDQVISSRDVLDRRFQTLLAHYVDHSVPRPPYWGGYRLVPLTVEFWQGGPHRLHDRLLYRHSSETAWTIERLSP